MELHLPDDLGKIDLEIDEAQNPFATIILAHGAGAGMHHPFMKTIAQGFADQGVHAIRFNFPYMQQGKKSPGSPKKNITTWNAVIEKVMEWNNAHPIFLAGKSYGGRMASHLLAENSYDQVNGIIYFGFPLHAPGRDSTERAAHLVEINVPQLFLQGTNDKLANIGLIHEVIADLEDVELIELEGGDHSFKVPKSSGLTMDDVFEQLTKSAIQFMKNNL